jgi:hypothetical protein
MRSNYLSVALIIFFQCSSSGSVSQQLNKRDVYLQLREIVDMPYNPELSGDKVFWEIVNKKLIAIDPLIELVSDTTSTKAPVPNFGGYYTVGDVAYHIITEIIRDIPTSYFVSKHNQKADSYWEYVRMDYPNRIALQKDLKAWFRKNKRNLVWVPDTVRYKTARNWPYQSNQHPAGGYFQLKRSD